MDTLNFSTVKDNEGRPVASLTRAELEKMAARCDAYGKACDERGLEPQANIKMICAAVDYYLNPPPDSIAAAFAEFSELRRQLIALGYTTPPIIGTPTSREIRRVCDVLREAIKAHVTLPGEPADVTQRIRNASREAVTEAIAEINAGREKPRPF